MAGSLGFWMLGFWNMENGDLFGESLWTFFDVVDSV